MSKAKRKRLEKESAKQSAEDQQNETSPWEGRRILIIVSVAFAILVGAIIGINHYFSEDQKYYRIDVIEVDDSTVSMDYFVRRCYATGSDAMSALTGMTKELVLLKEAEELGWEISEEAIEAKMIEVAQGDSETPITQQEFKEWFNQRLNETKLTKSEYKDIVRTQIISETFYDAIVEATPTAGEQVHLFDIVLYNEEDANDIVARFNEGESFGDLAQEYSIDSATRDQGGDGGWVPRGVVQEGRFDTVIFDELEIGAISDPLPYYDTAMASSTGDVGVEYFLFMITERDESREIDAQYLTTIYSDAFDDWVAAKLSEHDVQYHGINNGFDSETYSWINWQLQKLTGEDDEE